MLYSVYTVLGGYCTQYMLYSVFTHDHGMKIERDDLTLCSPMMAELWARKREGGWGWEQYGGFEQIWEFGGTTCLIGLTRPYIGSITGWIRSHTCHIGNSKMTRSHNSLTSHFPMISNFNSSLSFSSSTLPSPQNMKWSHPSVSGHDMIMGLH